ncbi:unnamed protein product [Rotaria sp. Silwood1]|nr:unnamed protein product [Rotaria sp. Silwood1]
MDLDVLTKWLMSDGSGYDIVEVDTTILGDLVNAGLIAPQFITSTSQADWHSVAATSVQINQAVYGFPHLMCSFFLFTRDEQVAAASTIDQLIKALSSTPTTKYRLVGNLDSDWDLPALWVTSYQDSDNSASEVMAFALHDYTKNSFQNMRKFVELCNRSEDENHCLDGTFTNNNDIPTILFARHQAAAMFGFAERLFSVLKYGNSNEYNNIKVIPLSIGSARNQPLFFTDAFVFRRNMSADILNASRLFTEFMGTPRMQAAIVGSGDSPGSITDIIQQRLLNTTDQVDESRFSPDLAAALLNDCKTAMNRITTLSEGPEASENILQCFLRLLNALGTQHIETELQYSLQAIPGPEPKQEPDIRFFHAILQTNNSIQLIERYFVMDIAPLLLGTQQQAILLQTKEKVFGQLEELINIGVDKALLCMIGYVRNILNEQKRSDFKPESDLFISECSPICKRVVRSIDNQIVRLDQTVDGKNLTSILNEFGLRFHRLITDHVFKFEYNISGGLMMLQDISEYKKCSKKFRSSTVEQLFSILHALVNLLVVVPDNLRQVITEGHLASLTRDIIESFVQLRTDYKSARLHAMITTDQ